MKSSLVQQLLEERHRDFTPAILEVIDAAYAEGLEPTDVAVGARVLAKITELKQPCFRGSQPLTAAEMAERIAEALNYEDQLLSMTLEQLREIYRSNRERGLELRRKRAALHDDQNFGHPRHEPDFQAWNKKIVWTVREALYLSMNKEPTATDFDLSPLKASILREDYELRKNALISMEGLDLETKKPIDYFVSWFREKGLSTPAGFGNPTPLDARDAETTIAELNAKIACLEAQLDKVTPEVDRTTSMHAMIFCMSVEKYNYDPRKIQNSAVKRIEDCMRKIAADRGNDRLKAKNNTVRNVLKDAARFLDEVGAEIDAEPTIAAP